VPTERPDSFNATHPSVDSPRRRRASSPPDHVKSRVHNRSFGQIAAWATSTPAFNKLIVALAGFFSVILLALSGDEEVEP